MTPFLPKPASPDLPTLSTVDAETIAALPVDPDPFGEITGIRATINTRVPVYAEPGGEALGWFDPVTVASPTVVPVFEVLEGDPDWLLVPVALTRAGLPSDGVTGQVVGWIWDDKVSDEVTIALSPWQIEVDLSDRAMRVRDLSTGQTALEVDDVGVGTESTPTPVGRTFIAATYFDDRKAYLAGEPVIMLGRFSDAVDAFTPIGGGGVSAAPVIALHHHATRGAEVSNGCLRLPPDVATWRAASVPGGTPGVIQAWLGAAWFLESR